MERENLYSDWIVERRNNMVLVVISDQPHWFTPAQAREYAQSTYLDALELADGLRDQARSMRDRLRTCASEAEATKWP